MQGASNTYPWVRLPSLESLSGEAHQRDRSNLEKSVPNNMWRRQRVPWKTSSELKWESLELRRKYLSLVQMYEIIFGYCDINCHHYFDIIGITRTRSNHEYKIRPKVTRSNYFKYSFFHRYVNDWNSLPSNCNVIS